MGPLLVSPPKLPSRSREHDPDYWSWLGGKGFQATVLEPRAFLNSAFVRRLSRRFGYFLVEQSQAQRAINGAISFLPKNPGGLVVIRDGTFTCDLAGTRPNGDRYAVLVNKSNVVLRGMGRSTTLKLADSANATLIYMGTSSESGCGVEDMELDVQKSVNSGVISAVMLRANKSFIRRVFAHDCPWMTIYATGRSGGLCYLEDSEIALSDQGGCLWENCDGMVIQNCLIRQNGNSADSGKENVLIQTGSPKRNWILDNEFVAPGEHDIYVQGTETVIRGNHFTNAGRSALRITASMVWVMDNRIDNSTSSGMDIEGSVADLFILNNIVENCGGAGMSPGGIFAKASLADGDGKTAKRLHIRGNTVLNDWFGGIALFGVTDSIIADNIVLNCSQNGAGNNSGIELKNDDSSDGCQRCNVHDNICTDDQGTKTQEYGIDEQDASDYNRIHDNILRGNRTRGLRTVGLNTAPSSSYPGT